MYRRNINCHRVSVMEDEKKRPFERPKSICENIKIKNVAVNFSI
jgi:hypothetical protein